jgi:hypothetical protein
MGFQPAFHPDAVLLWLPDFDRHHSLTVGTFKKVATKADFETLTPGERVKGFGKGVEVKEGKLAANGMN